MNRALSIISYFYSIGVYRIFVVGISTTACSDRAYLDKFYYVVPMCRSTTLRNTRVVIDTWGTGGPDVHSCNCNVTLDTGSAPSIVKAVTVQEYPGVLPCSSCGSKLRITSTRFGLLSETRCTTIPADVTPYFERADTFILTLSRTDVNTQWQSGHCISISQDDIGYDLTVTCQPAQGIPTTFPTTTEDIPTTTFKARETATTYQPRETTTYNITNSGSTTQETHDLSVVSQIIFNMFKISLRTASMSRPFCDRSLNVV